MHSKYKNRGCAVGVMVLLSIVGFFFMALILITLDTTYSEKEWLKDYLLTPNEIRQAPRLTSRYAIRVKARDGNSPAIEQITFYGTQDTLKLEQYLVSLGYYPASKAICCEIWYSPDNKLSAEVRVNSERSVTLTIYDIPAPQDIIEQRRQARP